MSRIRKELQQTIEEKLHRTALVMLITTTFRPNVTQISKKGNFASSQKWKKSISLTSKKGKYGYTIVLKLPDVIENILLELDEDNTDSNDEQEEEQEEISEFFMLSLLALNEVRYLEPRIYNIAKSQHWYNNILPSYDDGRFKKIMRMFSSSGR
ncbi:unnamed protein product [Rhizophagus irregularis]|nr:unnamed protein product [Rhizophagus irregularis]